MRKVFDSLELVVGLMKEILDVKIDLMKDHYVKVGSVEKEAIIGLVKEVPDVEVGLK